MKIGLPKEIKTLEFRVGMTPGVAHALAVAGHEVFVETGAGSGVGLSDTAYEQAGARILANADAVFAAADLIIKVKEPQAPEIARLQPRHILFTYLHLAADRAQAEGLMRSGCTAIAYETVRDKAGGLPLLAPMSQVAGCMAIDVGARALLRPYGGRGMLLGGVPGVAPANIIILGGGVAGEHAARIAMGHRADVTLLEISPARIAVLDAQFDGRLKILFSTKEAVSAVLKEADLVVGCVLVPGAKAPKLVSRADLATMKKGAVLVDVAIDQGGCFETSHPTTHDNPTFEIDGIVHYCVANMPGAAPLTATYALSAATAPYIEKLAKLGPDAALASDPGFAQGLNVKGGAIIDKAVADALGGLSG